MSDKDFKAHGPLQRAQAEFKDQFEHLTELKKGGKCHVKDGVVIDSKTSKPLQPRRVRHPRCGTRPAAAAPYQVDPKATS